MPLLNQNLVLAPRWSVLLLLLALWWRVSEGVQPSSSSIQEPHPNSGGPARQYSAICVVAKDENRYVREWVDYHRCLGVDHIYLYDHNSSQPLSTQIQDYIDDGFVTYHGDTGTLNHTKYHDGFSSNYARFMTTIQGQVYKDCMVRYASRHTFIGFIDLDEFLVLHDTSLNNINTFLKGFEGYGGVSLYWVMLGSSGQVVPPAAWVISSYTRCTPYDHFVNTQFKSFVNTLYWPTMYSPHRAQFEVMRRFLVNELEQRIPAGRNKNSTHTRVAVYHYATRSKTDFLGKLKRGGGAGVTRPPHYMRKLDSQCNETCGAAVATYLRTCSAQGLPSHLDQGVEPWAQGGPAAGGALPARARHTRSSLRQLY